MVLRNEVQLKIAGRSGLQTAVVTRDALIALLRGEPEVVPSFPPQHIRISVRTGRAHGGEIVGEPHPLGGDEFVVPQR